jgi:hypothetical protein
MKSENFIRSIHGLFDKRFKMALLSAMMVAWISSVNAQCPLACNDLVQISMDDDCNVTITPDVMLEGQGVNPNCNYTVTVYNVNGTPRTNPVITSADVDKTLKVRIFSGANSCWGQIKIEDKLPPIIDCRDRRVVACWDPLFAPTLDYPKPTVTDNCGGTLSPSSIVVVSDVTTERPCTDTLRARRIICYQATDASKNVSAICCDTVDYRGITLADVKFPKSYDGSPGNRPHFSCDGSWPWGGRNWNPLTRRYEQSYVEDRNGVLLTNLGSWDLDGDGYPDPNESGAPYVANAANITNYIRGYMVSANPPGAATVPGCVGGAKVGFDLATGPWRSSCDGGNGMLNFRIDTLYSPLLGGNSLCKMNVTYADSRVDICENSFKILRQWTVIEWCTGQVATKYQIIKVVDDKGPIVSIPTEADITIAPCQTNMTVSAIITADPYDCTGTWLAEIPTVTFDCDTSDLEYTVQFALADAQGQAPPTGGPYFFVRGETRSTLLTSGPNKGRWQLTNLPIGCSWIKYSVKDACGNVTEAFTEIRVIDRTPPVAVCDEWTVATLSTNGVARIFAKTFDDGSHDNCSDVGFEVARMFAGCGQQANAFGPYIDVCCSDITVRQADTNRDGVINNSDLIGHISVILKVWDDANGDGEFNDKVVGGRRDNANTCMVIVKVEDKTPPVITCPANVTIECGADTSSTIHGRPVLTSAPTTGAYYLDNCPNPTMSWTNSGAADNCGQGTINRRFTVYAAGYTPATAALTSASCTQTITFRNTVPYNGPRLESTNPIIWRNLGPKPAIPGCLGADTDPSKTGLPDLGETDCSQVAYTYEDQVFNFVDNVCYKILRKWTVIDWCKFAPNRNPQNQVYPSVPTLNVNMWTYTQTIKVSDESNPEVTTVNANKVFDGDNANCGAEVELEETAEDCSDAAEAALKWEYVIDIFDDGNIINTPLASSNNNVVRGTSNGKVGSVSFTVPGKGANFLPVGRHKITWTVEDQCGNQTVKEYTFTVRDTKKPTPYCLGSLTTVVMPQGVNFVEIWAKDFDRGSTDNCPAPPSATCALYFTFRINGQDQRPVTAKLNQVHYFKGNGSNATVTEYESGLAQQWNPATCSSAMYFDCDDVNASPLTMEMSVWDQSWNSDYCTVTLNVQANDGDCVGSRIAGNISRSSTEMIKNVHVTLSNLQNNESKISVSNDQGMYSFSSMSTGSNYSIQPVKDDDYLNGVSTLDLVLIQRHVLNIGKFDSASKYLAGDINKDNKITSIDLVELRKLILGIYDKLPNNKSWRFIDKKSTFSDISNPWGASESITVQNFSATKEDNHFTAIKVGDINSSATVNANAPIENRSKKTLTFNADDVEYTEGEEVIVNVTSENFANIVGAQWLMNFDAKALEIKNILPGVLTLDATNYNAKTAGSVKFSWNETKGQSFDKNEILFTIVFRATANGQLSNTVSLTSDQAHTEAYTQSLDVLNLALNFNNRVKEVFSLDQNSPNPFTDKTAISFSLPQAGEATFKVYDLTGKVVFTTTHVYPKGKSDVIVRAEDLPATGVLFYELESQGFKSTKKMIYLGK